MLGRNWVGATAAEIARAVRRGDAAATGVIADHVEHARVADRVLGALRALRDAAALAEAEQVEDLPDLANLPLAGVPVLVSEDTPVAGQPVWSGDQVAGSLVAERDHEVVRRLRGAGAVVLGAARRSELDLWPTTDDGTVTRNPWRSDRMAGGAGGGSAAAVAAGLVPVALGTDGLGGVRIPAACCGLIGFKPGRGVVPADISAADWFGLAEHGVLATTVADAASAFAVMAGREPGGPVPPGRLRIAISLRGPVPAARPDRDVRRAVARAARVLAAQGHDGVWADPPYPVRLPIMIAATWCAIAHQRAEQFPAIVKPPRTWRQAALGAYALRRNLVRAGERADWRERCTSWFAEHRFDLLLMPSLAGPPPPSLPWSARSWRSNVITALRCLPYTAPWNLAGLPSIAVPMGLRGDGLPASAQLVGPPGAESVLLAAAAELATMAGWRRHAPTWPRLAAPVRGSAPATRSPVG